MQNRHLRTYGLYRQNAGVMMKEGMHGQMAEVTMKSASYQAWFSLQSLPTLGLLCILWVLSWTQHKSLNAEIAEQGRRAHGDN
jgi:hypothetical protein